MSKLIPGNQKHLTLNDRLYIEQAINEGRTFKDIAKNLCKDPTTISKEVKAHRLSVWKDHGLFVNMKNFCEHRYHCRKTNASLSLQKGQRMRQDHPLRNKVCFMSNL